MQYVDTAISKKKFKDELNLFKANEALYRERGIILLQATFPNIFLAFVAKRPYPASIVFVARLNFENYDMDPISLRFVDPFTFTPLMNFGIPFYRKLSGSGELQSLMQQNKGKLPFLCIAGIREYHNHARHTGDLWFLHRKIGGEGTMGFIVEKLYDYGVLAIDDYIIKVPVKLNPGGKRKVLNNQPINIDLISNNLKFRYNTDKIPL